MELTMCMSQGRNGIGRNAFKTLFLKTDPFGKKIRVVL
jgi:hypothetical protein